MDVRREADHLEHDFVVGLGVLRAGIADGDGLRKHRAVDLHIAVAAGFEIGADELVRVALEDFDDFAFGILAANIALAWKRRTSTVSPLGGIARRLAGMKISPLRSTAGVAPLGRTKPKPAVLRRNTPVTRFAGEFAARLFAARA